jgi:hypothetical protein
MMNFSIGFVGPMVAMTNSVRYATTCTRSGPPCMSLACDGGAHQWMPPAGGSQREVAAVLHDGLDLRQCAAIDAEDWLGHPPRLEQSLSGRLKMPLSAAT